MGFKSRIGRIFRCGRELGKSPFIVGKDVLEGFYQDGVRVKRSGTTALFVGGVTAAATLPFRRIVVPATLAGRAAKNCKSSKGAAVAGFAGGLVGIALVVYVAEVAVIIYVAEAMAMAAKADARAEQIESRKAKKAEIAAAQINSAADEIEVGGSVAVDAY